MAAAGRKNEPAPGAPAPVILADSLSPPDAAKVAPNVLNISASSEIADSSEVNATDSAIHREGTVETSAFPIAGVSKRNASANSSALGVRSSASIASLFATASASFASVFSSATGSTALIAAANRGSSSLSTGAGSCATSAVFTATAATAAGVSGC